MVEILDTKFSNVCFTPMIQFLTFASGSDSHLLGKATWHLATPRSSAQACPTQFSPGRLIWQRIWLCGILAGILSLACPSERAAGPRLAAQTPQACAEIQRQLPPEGIAVPPEQLAAWHRQIASLQAKLDALPTSPSAPDVQILLKACRYALDIHELYQTKDFAKVDRLVDLAAERLTAIEAGQSPWATGSGLQVRGFTSAIDGSAQPLGLVLPEDWATDSQRSLPLYVWLHGRGDKSTDLHFICERLDKTGQIAPANAIVVHPFGRQCIGFKSAGETDVMEAIDFVCENYPVDRERIVLMGFSMGGAGVWHLAAHYGERFAAASPGAGFAETSRYQRLKPEHFPPRYEQILWSIYDVPGYTRNLFNFPFVAYSGELDKQIQAAQVMEEAFAAEGRQLPHLIGPGMGHKYHPDTLAEILRRMHSAVEQGRGRGQQPFSIQSQHPRYSSFRWLVIDGAEQQYADTRADASFVDSHWHVTTKNVSRLRLRILEDDPIGSEMIVDDNQLQLPSGEAELLLTREADQWRVVDELPELRKRPRLSGPIDDAFIDPFLVVVPSGQSAHPAVDQWVACELENFKTRWRDLFRGDLRIKSDQDVTPEDMQRYHLILWGTPHSNRVINALFTAGEQQVWPLQWNTESARVGQWNASADQNVLLAIYPNPLANHRYIVLNSGPTFRQAHDRTNSLQNPHLPDWAIIGLDQPPSDTLPGRVVHTGFFDDAWQPSVPWTW
ncbi:Putative esterase [Aureliella helgolandensis]|uniref:Esterase n=2 Tax=Aureliella helgolandensis TaxID=2527968 RepID=A0A518GFB4_9BACT|nr:Putative esterase [Aureliella helgolandensis]